MMKVRNLGRKSLEEVINKLAMMGLHLADEDNNKMLRQQVTDFLDNGKMETTLARAKEIKPLAEK